METHDDVPGAEPDNLTPQDALDFDRGRALREARIRAMAREEWISDEFMYLERALVDLNDKFRKREKGKQNVVFFASAAEVLKAKDSGVIDKNEARKLLGLSRKRQPAALRRARAKV
jgi:hypothetical protein